MTVNKILQSLPSNYLKDLTYNFKGFEIRFKPHADNLRGLKKHDDTNLASSSLSFFKALTFLHALIRVIQISVRGLQKLKHEDANLGHADRFKGFEIRIQLHAGTSRSLRKLKLENTNSVGQNYEECMHVM